MTDSDLALAKFLRLKNGDDIIADVVELGEDDNVHYMVINPLKVIYMESKSPGYLQIAFMPWVFPKICDCQEFTIYSDDVMLITDVSQNMNEHYWESVDAITAYKESGKVKKDLEPDYQDDLESLEEILQTMTSKRTLH